MTPDQPQEFLTALWHHAQSAEAALENAALWAKTQGVIAHVLGLPGGTTAQIAALQAAGARAIAASLPMGGGPILLLSGGTVDAPDQLADHLTAGLQGYERIHALVGALTAPATPARISPEGLQNPAPQTGPIIWAILILPPTEANAYWGPKA